MGNFKKRKVSNFLLLISMTLLATGFYTFEKYKHTEGAQVIAPKRFPDSLSTYLDKKVPTLVLFAHPKCTCTEATLAELERLKADLGSSVAVKVFISYDQRGYNAEHEQIEAKARQISEVEVKKDVDRVIAKQFGALTSGQTILYAPEGNLLFQGGITIARGHEGESPGALEIKRIVTAPFIINSYGRLPTFGCHL